MNKEIKDLIEQLGVCSVNDYNFEIYGSEAKILEEYISNLQSENKQLKEAIKRCYTQEEVDFEIMPVKAELEAEKDSNNNLHKTIDKLRVNLYEIQQDKDNLQNRTDNAIEYINKFEDIKAYYSYEENGYEEYNYDEDFKIDLLEILKGGD